MEIKKTTFGELFGLIIILSMLNAAFAQGLASGFQEVNAAAYAIVGLVIVLFIGYMFTRRFMQEFMGESKFAAIWDKLILAMFVFAGFSAIITMFGIEVPFEAQQLMGLPIVLVVGLISGTMLVEGGMYSFSKFLTKHKGALTVEELRAEAVRAANLGDTQRSKALRELAKDMEKEVKYLNEAEKEAKKLGKAEDIQKIEEAKRNVVEQAEIAATLGQVTEIEHEVGKGKSVVEEAKKALEKEEMEIAKEAKIEIIEVEKKDIFEEKELKEKLKTIADPRLRKQTEKIYKEEAKEIRALEKARKVQEGMAWLESTLPQMEKKEFKEEEKAERKGEEEMEKRAEQKGKEMGERLKKINKKYYGGQ